MTATVTYNGVAAGLINNRSIAFGSYQNVWSFANRSGVATLNFDGARFQALTSGNGNSPTFNTNGRVPASNVANRSLELNGRFVGFPGNPAAAQVGTFNINGRGYNADGGFVGFK